MSDCSPTSCKRRERRKRKRKERWMESGLGLLSINDHNRCCPDAAQGGSEREKPREGEKGGKSEMERSPVGVPLHTLTALFTSSQDQALLPLPSTLFSPPRLFDVSAQETRQESIPPCIKPPLTTSFLSSCLIPSLYLYLLAPVPPLPCPGSSLARCFCLCPCVCVLYGAVGAQGHILSVSLSVC